MLPFLAPLIPLWNVAGKYVIIGGLILLIVGGIYVKGRWDEQSATAVDILERDIANREQSETIRRDVDTAPDITERLRRWEQPGR